MWSSTFIPLLILAQASRGFAEVEASKPCACTVIQTVLTTVTSTYDYFQYSRLTVYNTTVSVVSSVTTVTSDTAVSTVTSINTDDVFLIYYTNSVTITVKAKAPTTTNICANETTPIGYVSRAPYCTCKRTITRNSTATVQTVTYITPTYYWTTTSTNSPTTVTSYRSTHTSYNSYTLTTEPTVLITTTTYTKTVFAKTKTIIHPPYKSPSQFRLQVTGGDPAYYDPRYYAGYLNDFDYKFPSAGGYEDLGCLSYSFGYQDAAVYSLNGSTLVTGNLTCDGYCCASTPDFAPGTVSPYCTAFNSYSVALICYIDCLGLLQCSSGNSSSWQARTPYFNNEYRYDWWDCVTIGMLADPVHDDVDREIQFRVVSNDG